jgi:hypothetical protein
MLNLIILRNNFYYIFNVKSIRIYVCIFSNWIEILLRTGLATIPKASIRYRYWIILVRYYKDRYVSIRNRFLYRFLSRTLLKKIFKLFLPRTTILFNFYNSNFSFHIIIYSDYNSIYGQIPVCRYRKIAD